MNDAFPTLRFPQGFFPDLCARLLRETHQESFALLLGKRISAGGHTIVRIADVAYPCPQDYEEQGLTSLHLKREFIYGQLVRLQREGRYDMVIDVHTHPFIEAGVAFSGADDRDEKDFCRWLSDTVADVGYASIVLSRTDYAARVWEMNSGWPEARSARIKAQTVAEAWPCADHQPCDATAPNDVELQTGFLARSVLALGVDTLRKMMTDQVIAVVGVGGLGSVIAEHLIHSGFQSLHLIDPDRVEITNLNRIVGAYRSDAEAQRHKVDVVAQHLQRINPDACVGAHVTGIEDEALIPVLMQCDWIVVATDSHFSRFHAQRIALQLGVPLISAGVNITVTGQSITDMSGEVIIARYGDGLCLNCLGRINPTLVAAEEHREEFVGVELVRRGYVAGRDVKEPAVKTLNSTVGSIAVDVLLNQFTQRQRHFPVWVYENNAQFAIYAELDSVEGRQMDCLFCSSITRTGMLSRRSVCLS